MAATRRGSRSHAAAWAASASASMGYRTYPGGEMEPAPVYFPLDNDPFESR